MRNVGSGAPKIVQLFSLLAAEPKVGILVSDYDSLAALQFSDYYFKSSFSNPNASSGLFVCFCFLSFARAV